MILLLQSQISTVIVVIITSNIRLAEAPGNVLLPRGVIGFVPRDSVGKCLSNFHD